MVLAQWEAARLVGSFVPRAVIYATVAGTLSIYGADRFLERKRMCHTAIRHHAPLVMELISVLFIASATLAALPRFGGREWIWFSVLGAAGALYLAVTVDVVRALPAVKEILGAFCFTYLVWGMLPRKHVFLAFFFMMGLSNFLWSGHQDRERDRKNGLRSLALTAPCLNCRLGRLSALFAGVGFLATAGFSSPFFWVSAIHGLWPFPEKRAIDLAFLPLTLVVFQSNTPLG